MKSTKNIDRDSFVQLLNHINNLNDQKCFHYTKSYGGAYNFDFGEKVQFSDKVFGSWWISTCGTNFTVKQGDNIVVDTRNLDLDNTNVATELQQTLKLFLGQSVTEATVDYDSLALLVQLDGELSISINPTSEDDEFELPYWIVVFPNKSSLAVGPNRRYTYSDSGTVSPK